MLIIFFAMIFIPIFAGGGEILGMMLPVALVGVMIDMVQFANITKPTAT
jgi:hypothetical protein